ncbi:PucR family transcriptional regulator ligand-binding domain-containing protein [Streptomyces sp. NBC_01537]|uniref:PucR family transcriptional regulator n=1 Tax=Streptomyces sp. NBC_01537 TaxID=2903896 RepID=UPI00386FD7EB
MALSVRDLVTIPSPRTWAVAGEQGLDRLVTWAHVSELPDIAKWLRGGEMIMTVGMGFPTEAEAQERYVRELVQAGAQALIVAESDYAPPLTDRMLAVADELAFPVLRTAMATSFAGLARAVAGTDSPRAGEQFLVTQQVYDTARRTSQGELAPERALALLSEAAGADLFVIDPVSALPFLGPAPEQPLREHIGAVLRPRLRSDGRLPGVVRLSGADGPTVHALPIATQCPAVLATADDLSAAALSALPHVASVLAAEVDHLLAAWERRRQQGSEVLGRLLARREPEPTDLGLLADRGLGAEPRVVAACRGPRERELDRTLRLYGVPHAVLARTGDLLLVLLPDAPDALSVMRGQLDEHGHVGLSAPLGRPDRFAEASREARFALEDARTAALPVSRYGEQPAGVLPLRGLDEAERLAEAVLGPVRAYDAEHNSDLLTSLAVFLDHNRSWQRAAAELHVHKQTLVYRIRRAEELSGHHVDRTADVAKLWFALDAARRLGWFSTLA